MYLVKFNLINLQGNGSLIGPPVSALDSPINATTKHLYFTVTHGFHKNEQKSVQAFLIFMLKECSP